MRNAQQVFIIIFLYVWKSSTMYCPSWYATSIWPSLIFSCSATPHRRGASCFIPSWGWIQLAVLPPAETQHLPSVPPLLPAYVNYTRVPLQNSQLNGKITFQTSQAFLFSPAILMMIPKCITKFSSLPDRLFQRNKNGKFILTSHVSRVFY